MVFREAPYGELVSTTMRVMTWNVWGRFGPWQERAPGIVHAIQAAAPDVVFLQECWCDDSGANQAEPLGQQLGMEHHFGAGDLVQLEPLGGAEPAS